MAKLRSLPLYALASAFLLPLVSHAQQAAPQVRPQVRIVQPVDETQLVTLKGNTHPAAIAKNDRGPVSASLPMAGLTLVLSRSADEQAAFDAFVSSQYDQSSPNYHQWLTPAQIGERFGPAQADINTVSSWLSGHGFAVKSISPDHMTINFSGTAGQIESTFHTQIHNLNVNGVAHIGNMTDPQIPAALAPVILGIKGLHNFFPHPLHRMGSKVQFNPDAHGWVKQQNALAPNSAARTSKAQASANASSPKPGFYFSSGYLGVEEDIAPSDFAAIYNLPSGWPNSNNGSNQTITIIGTSDIDTGDVTEFKKVFGLPTGLTPVIAHGPDGDPGICSGSTNACSDGDLEENSLDVEWSGAVAPGAQIALITDAYNNQSTPTNDPIFDGAQWAVDNAYVQGSAVYGSRIISVSYGECELYSGTASNVAYNDLWQTAAAGGIAVFVAAGDSGSPSCDDGFDTEEGNPYEAQYGLSVSGIASTPYNTAVGGTDFSWCQPTLITSGSSAGNSQGCASTNASKYWNTSNSPTQASAKGYVPETPWNDTCENPLNAAFLESIASYVGAGTYTTAEESCNFVYQDSLTLYFEYDDPALMQYVDTTGGSGGASNCVLNNADTSTSPTCTTSASSTGSTYGNLPLFNNGWPKPSWQATATSLGVPDDGVRDLPDVSFFSGDGTLDSATLICVTNDSASCTDISNTGTATGGAEEIGGTSVATPEMAGVMALINEKAGAPQGNPNAELYSLAAKQTYSSCSAETGSTSSSCYFNDIDQGTNSMPCVAQSDTSEGGAIYAGGGVWDEGEAYQALVSPNCVVLNSGDSVGTLISSGTTPAYNASTGFDLATGLGSLNVANVLNAWTPETIIAPGTATFTLSATTPSAISAGGTATSTVTATGTNGYAGTVTVTCALISQPTGAIDPPTCGNGASTIALSSATTTGSTTVTVNSTAPTTISLAPAPAKRLGWFAAAGGTMMAAFLLFFIPGGSSRAWRKMLSGFLLVAALGFTAIGCGGSVSSGSGTGTQTKATPTITVKPASSSIAVGASLSVSVSVAGSGSTPTGTVTLSSGSYTSSAATLASGAATITIPASSLAVGTDTLTVSYSGDTNYNSATGSASETVTSTSGGTTAGTYTFLVTGTGNDAATTTATTTFSMTVN